MTEKSFYHDGTALNDALNSPYSAEEFSDLLEILNGPVMGTYVLPGQLNGLAVTAGAGRDVNVATGRAFLKGHWYENDAIVNLSLSTNTSGLPRWDRVILQINLTTGTPSLKVIEGGYAVLPSVPALAPVENVVQMSLARIYIPNGYAAVSAYYVHDERQFANNAYHQINYSTRNLFINGNFILFGCNPNATAARRPMDTQWAAVAFGTRWRGVPGFPTQQYGRAVRSDLDTAGGDGFSTILLTTENAAEPMTLSLWVHPTAGEVAIALGATTMRVPAVPEPMQVIIRGSFTGYQTFSITHQTTGTDVIFGDIRFSHGYVVADERHVGPALVMLSTLVGPNRTGAASFAGITGASTDIDTFWEFWGSDEDHQGVLAEHSPPVALLVNVEMQDDNSAAGAPTVRIVFPSGASVLNFSLEGLTNSVPRDYVAIVPQTYTSQPDSNRVKFSLTSATNMTVIPSVIGAIL